MPKKLLTLVIIEKDGQVLLGMKKRGFGAGRWNGFGGKVEGEESLFQAAKRETLEESGIDVEELYEKGIIEFEFKRKQEILEVHIFKATNWQGEPGETEEMSPKWFDVSEIPYEEMWTDDKYWLPLFLEGKKFKGYFLFDGNDQVLKHKLEEIVQIRRRSTEVNENALIL
jgi:8-oxo-dGTP diphosphatase/2-hydroxy-dATP diphosphatase